MVLRVVMEVLVVVEVEEVLPVQVPELVVPEVMGVEAKCGFILGNKIFIKIKLWQII
jgi:hypothetical protein